MGKLADNEKIKLGATFYNNLAVGAFIGGALLPLVNFYQQHHTILEFVAQTSSMEIIRFLMPMMLAFCAAGFAKSCASGLIMRLQD